MLLFRDFSRNINPVQFQRHLLAHNAPVFALDVDFCGDTFISGGADKVVKLWTVSGQKLLGQFRKHNNAVRYDDSRRESYIYMIVYYNYRDNLSDFHRSTTTQFLTSASLITFRCLSTYSNGFNYKYRMTGSFRLSSMKL